MPIRYLGILIAADGSTQAQTEWIDAEVHRRLERIRLSRCPGGMVNYIVKAVAGGLLNYHAPFTRISRTRQKKWDRHVLKVLGEKAYVQRTRSWVHYVRHKGGDWDGFQQGVASMRQC